MANETRVCGQTSWTFQEHLYIGLPGKCNTQSPGAEEVHKWNSCFNGGKTVQLAVVSIQSTDTSLAMTIDSFLPRRPIRINSSLTRKARVTVIHLASAWSSKCGEELRLKYAMFVRQQLDRVKEDDILAFSFLGSNSLPNSKSVQNKVLEGITFALFFLYRLQSLISYEWYPTNFWTTPYFPIRY